MGAAQATRDSKPLHFAINRPDNEDRIVGDQLGIAGDQAALIPPSETERLLASSASAEDRASAFATICRINALGMIHLAGSGHIGSSFSSLDIVSWLLTEHLDDDDVFFSSKGHDVPGYYAALLALGRLDWDLVSRLRRLGGLPGHPDVRTPGITFNTGSLGMGISKAKGLVHADRIAGRERKIVVMTGDGELQEGQIWESLGTAARDGMREITVVVDHNRLQSDMAVAKVSDLGDLEAKFAAFGWTVSRCDGNDVAEVAEAFSRSTEGPHVIIADTRKGAGVAELEYPNRPADERFYPFHSGALPEERYAAARDELMVTLTAQFDALGLGDPAVEIADRAVGKAPAIVGEPQYLLAAYGRALVDAGERRGDVVVLDADLMVDCQLVDFADRFPERFIECGIAEQDMVSQASGLAAGGMLPIVNSFAAFLSQRPSEQIANVASESRKVIYMGALGSIIPAGPGHSHQATRDLSAFGSLDEIVTIVPGSEQQVADAVAWATGDTDKSVYLRLASLPVATPYGNPGLPPVGYGMPVHESLEGRVAVVTYGPVLLTEAWHAVTSDEDLARQVDVVSLPWVSDPDTEWVRALADRADLVVVLDDHTVRGGIGERLAARVDAVDSSVPVAVYGVQGLPECGQPDEVLEFHGLGRVSLASVLHDVCGRVDGDAASGSGNRVLTGETPR